MRFLSAPLLWLRALFSRHRVEDEMAREMRAHLDMQLEAYIRSGLSPDEARRRALIDFGGVERYKEEVRGERRTSGIDDLITDVRLALRGMAAHRGFTAVVVLTIAIGIGATTAVYSWAAWALFRPVPGVRDPGRLVSIGFQRETKGGISPAGISYPNFVDLAASLRSFSGLAGDEFADAQISASDAQALEVHAGVVIGDYFGVLGVVPRPGRSFSPDELTATSSARVVILADSIAGVLFGSPAGALGRTVRVNALPYTVIGVAPAGFRGPDRDGTTAAWFPPSAYPLLYHQNLRVDDRQASLFQQLVARLRPGVTSSQAQMELKRQVRVLIAAYPKVNAIYQDYGPVVNPDLGMPTWVRGRVVTTVRQMLGIVALLLLITVANVANLLVLRGLRRREDVAIRRALGASHRRILRQHVREGLLYSVCGAAGGVLVAVVLTRLFGSANLYNVGAFRHLVLDRRVLGVMVGVALVTGVVFGIVPGAAALRGDPMSALKLGAGRQAPGRGVGRGVLTIVQVGAAMTLVVGAGLLARTLYNLGRVDLGFDPNSVSVFTISLRPQGYPASRMHQIRQEVLDRATALPGVQAAIVTSLPGLGATYSASINPVGDTTKASRVGVMAFSVSSDYFRVLGMPLVRGHTFSRGEFDDTTSRSAVLSVAAARAMFGTEDAVGRRFEFPTFRGPPAIETVIGIVPDVRVYGAARPQNPALYTAAGVGPFGPDNPYLVLALRSRRSTAQLHRDVQSIMAREAPGVPVMSAESLAAMVARPEAERRLFARLVTVLSVLAAVLAAIGLYSVVAFSVAQRQREIGIRMALGAQHTAVVRLVARQAFALTIVGLVVGTAGAVALARVISNLLFGVGPLDPAVYVAAAGAWALLALLATVVPARAATRVDPSIAMRAE
jgi:putative ABC transport system permease protein